MGHQRTISGNGMSQNWGSAILRFLTLGAAMDKCLRSDGVCAEAAIERNLRRERDGKVGRKVVG